MPVIKEQKISKKSKTQILAIAGASGSGKSTIVRNVAALFKNAKMMFYDDYRPNYDKLTKDLEELHNGHTIKYPSNNRIIHPNQIIVLEEPTGRRRKGMDDKIDFLVYINTPLEICLARVLIRSIEQSRDEAINSFFDKIGTQFEPKFSEEKPSKLMHILNWQLNMYLKQHRQEYLEDHERNMRDADIVVDGMKTSDELAKEIVEKYSEKK